MLAAIAGAVLGVDGEGFYGVVLIECIDVQEGFSPVQVLQARRVTYDFVCEMVVGSAVHCSEFSFFMHIHVDQSYKEQEFACGLSVIFSDQ
jgi:hypothetical protein